MIHELVIIPSEIENPYTRMTSLMKCPDCGSHLMYFKVHKGIVVKNDKNFGIMGFYGDGKRHYAVREIGFTVRCAKCGNFVEDYYKFYHEDELIYDFDDIDNIDDDEEVEIQYCLDQFNQTLDFTPRYKFGALITIKEKLLEYEKNHPRKVEKK